jgi:multiple sugar transport system substrate-binding protein
MLSRRNLLKLMGVSLALSACAPAPAAPAAGGEAASGSAAAPSQAAETVVLMYNTNEISQEELAAFTAEYGIEVEFIETDLTKLFASLAAGNPVDCFRIYGTNTPALAARGIPLDLSDYFANSTIVALDDLLPVNDLYVAEGKRYGMVKDWSPDFSIFANTKLWGEMGVDVPDPTEPMHYTQWRELSPKLTKTEGDRTLIFGTNFTPNEHVLFWITTTFAQPTHLFSEDFSTVALRDNPDTLEFINFWIDWMKEGGIPSAVHPTIAGWSGQDWVQGQAATVQWGYWFSGMALSDEVVGEDILMMRAPTWGPTYSNPCASGAGMMLTSVTKVPDSAWKLFEWFMGELPAENRAKSGWGVPGLTSMLDLMPRDEPWRQHNYDMVQWEIENTAVPVIEFSPYMTPDAFKAAWAKYEEPAVKGDMSVDEMLTNVENEVNVAIQEGMDRVGA